VRPAPRLLGMIDSYSDYSERTTGFSTRRELPHADGVMIINLGDPVRITGGDGMTIRLAAGEAFVAGAHLRPAYSASGGMQAGMHVRLSLHAIRRIVGIPMSELRDRVVPLDALFGSRWAELSQPLLDAESIGARVNALDALLVSCANSKIVPGSPVTRALNLLRSRPDIEIAAVARNVGWSRKHLANRVDDAIGVGPRSFRRLVRFQRLTTTIASSTKPDWARLAASSGYSDQSHMIREFREFAGITPGEYTRRLLPEGGGLIES
jgi:AraC-like DNA-binding protein